VFTFVVRQAKLGGEDAMRMAMAGGNETNRWI
jgi:hypothetical protein